MNKELEQDIIAGMTGEELLEKVLNMAKREAFDTTRGEKLSDVVADQAVVVMKDAIERTEKENEKAGYHSTYVEKEFQNQFFKMIMSGEVEVGFILANVTSSGPHNWLEYVAATMKTNDFNLLEASLYNLAGGLAELLKEKMLDASLEITKEVDPFGWFY